MDRVRVGPAESEVIEVAYLHDGLHLPGIHADGVRVAWGVLRIMLGLPDAPEGERAMAIAINAYIAWAETHGIAAPLAYAKAKHQKRLLACGKGCPEEIARQLAAVRR
jgi:hypothetical protein